MIIQEFSVGNFLSFKEVQTLDLSAAEIVSKEKQLDIDNVIADSHRDVGLLKSKIVYGANGSGKSNLVKAFRLFQRIIGISLRDPDVLKFIDSFRLSTETENEPTFFEILFWHEGVRYRYGFEADAENILSEWLFGKSADQELPFFIRENQAIIELGKTTFTEADILTSLLSDHDSQSGDNDLFRNNALLLSTLASFGFGRLSRSLVDAINSTIVICGLNDEGVKGCAREALEDTQTRGYILNFLQNSDLGIENITRVEIPIDHLQKDLNDHLELHSGKNKKRKYLVSTRKKFNEDLKVQATVPFSFEYQESEGTKRLFEMVPFIYEALTMGRPIIIDEFDARFHHVLTRRILKLFNSDQNTTGQLVFTTHDTSLMNSKFLRRDQIDFVEKDQYGASHLFCLVEFKGIGNTASYEKDYISGRFGAIPFMGNLNKIFNK